MKGIQNKTLLVTLLISVAGANAMYPDNLQFEVERVYAADAAELAEAAKPVVEATKQLTRMEQVTGALKGAGSKVAGGFKTVGNAVVSGASAAGTYVATSRPAKAISGAVKSGYDYVADSKAGKFVSENTSKAAKFTAEKASQAWNYNVQVKGYNVPAGKIAIGVAATGIAYGIYKIATRNNKVDQVFASFAKYFSAIEEQVDLCKNSQYYTIMQRLNKIRNVHETLATEILSLANNENDKKELELALGDLFEYVRAVEYACYGYVYNVQVVDGKLKTQLLQGYYIDNNRKIIIEQAMLLLDKQIKDIVKPLAADVCKNSSNLNLVARAKSILAKIADGLVVAKAAVVTKAKEHPYISAGVATVAVAGGAYAAYKAGHYPTVAGMKEAGNKAIDKAVVFKDAVKSFEYKNAAINTGKQLVSAGKYAGSMALVPAQYVGSKVAAPFVWTANTTAGQYVGNKIANTSQYVANKALAAKDVVVAAKDVAVAHPYASSLVGATALTGAAYAGRDKINNAGKKVATVTRNGYSKAKSGFAKAKARFSKKTPLAPAA